MQRPKVLIITGYGVNCEAESAEAWRRAGADPVLVHVNDLLSSPDQIDAVDGLMFIGGFSYGDHMSSGHVFAQRIKHHIQPRLQTFIDAGKVMLGICNGFQVMTKMGLLPGLNGDYFIPSVSLIQNDCGHFQNYWVNIRFEDASRCIFTKGLGTLPLPIRHGEGKIFTLDAALLEQLEEAGCVAARYVDAAGNPTDAFPDNPNGSLHAIAGLSDPTGRIFGMMPHPEAYLFPENHPQWDVQKRANSLPEEGLGLMLFRNAVEAMNEVMA
ncbi:MAG: phosphoribosylformylglycinamidine synthase [Kiritimatiellaceae bacterium]|jgi:phosphoribosylformylglycinamidine synthase I|nr:phosphoribosylformylglycinamidine synthase [Kiritimatiellaceae bacterium]|tara:strand:+ start:164 stop:970 length:807 start_codon:yes stop_codon:yes gene_type:complete